MNKYLLNRFARMFVSVVGKVENFFSSFPVDFTLFRLSFFSLHHTFYPLESVSHGGQISLILPMSRGPPERGSYR